MDIKKSFWIYDSIFFTLLKENYYKKNLGSVYQYYDIFMQYLIINAIHINDICPFIKMNTLFHYNSINDEINIERNIIGRNADMADMRIRVLMKVLYRDELKKFIRILEDYEYTTKEPLYESLFEDFYMLVSYFSEDINIKYLRTSFFSSIEAIKQL